MKTSIVENKTRPWHIAGLIAILLLAVFLHFYRLDQEGYANLYYAATVKSMLTSWHNFFYASFDPGGFVSVDKPPLGLWTQALSASIFGFHGWALLLPQALAGVLSVLLLYHLVRRVFGPTPGLIAALVLALTPIFVAANRNNTMDSQLVLTSLLAAWTACLATERGQFRYLLLTALLVGIGFNIKMLQAFLVLPAVFLVYLFAPIKFWRRLVHLSVATVVLLVVSLSWAIAVDLTPASQRPYVGSSHNNTVMELIIGHNGAARLGQLVGLIGVEVGGPARIPGSGGNQPPAGTNPGMSPGAPPAAAPQNPAQGSPPRQPQIPGNQPPAASVPQPGNPQAQQPGGRQATGGGFPNEVGFPGVWRLFNQQLAGQISWFLPLSLLCILAAAWQRRLTWPLDARHISIILWGVWLIPQVIFFSFAGLFHRYYLEMVAPAIAALVGIGLVAMWDDYSASLSIHLSDSTVVSDAVPLNIRLRGWLLPVALVGTAAVEAIILVPFPQIASWLVPVVIGLPLLGAITLVVVRFLKSHTIEKAARRQRSSAWVTALALVALLVAPAVWSAIPVWFGGDSGLPFAGPEAIRKRPPQQDQKSSRLVEFLLANRQGETFILAALNSRTAAPIILETGEPVMALGGFSGSDKILNIEELDAIVKSGIVRFFLLPAVQADAPRPGQIPPNKPGMAPPIPPTQGIPSSPSVSVSPQGGSQAELFQWLLQTCRVVNPDILGISPRPGAGPSAPNEPMQLWDCRP